mmetsp:Transcript_63176/g.137373  ORF Transcript_63176/g.137373 Transcript_63176/m.137373 type:complete len:103 (+) Transcript_63176:103-411(+)
MTVFFRALLHVAVVGSAALRLQFSECPLCVAEEKCHEACSSLRQQSPGSLYCLNACNGAHPSDSFGDSWFEDADKKMQEREALDRSMKQIGEELAAEDQEKP